ncbi:F-box protein SKIP2-like [Aphidius gifuensis]|uniref:F-box protein SKIP2-like n=1 Tax=Aphidius gifuensis TaxID=684658 RepID=UPI001CDBFE12|nr:F-box protein SKIP2-like [Aphidius gifuensis]
MNHDSLAQIFMLLPVPERIAMEKEACELAWYDIKKYTFGETTSRFFDESLFAPSYIEKLLSNFGIYLRDLSLFEHCNSSIMPIIGERCKNLTRLNLIYNELLEMNIDHYIRAFKNLDKLTIIEIRVMNMGSCYNTKFQPHIINYLPEEMIKIILEYDKEEYMSPKIFDIKKFKKLQYLSLKGCLLDDMIQEISETTTLVELSLIDCFVRNESINTIVTISNWKKLKHLILFNDEGCDVIDDNIIGPAPSVVNFDELSKLQYLESLSLFNMYNFPDSSIIAIANSCKNLRKLEMTACVNITEAALMPIISLEKLEEINVNYMNGLTDNFISKLKGLKKFGCACCKNITDAGIIEFIKNCPNLHTLCVFGCNITIKTFIGADEITKHRTNNIALGISYEDFAEASTLKIESNWLFICPKVRENVK